MSNGSTQHHKKSSEKETDTKSLAKEKDLINYTSKPTINEKDSSELLKKSANQMVLKQNLQN